jgi:hypothetical protein
LPAPVWLSAVNETTRWVEQVRLAIDSKTGALFVGVGSSGNLGIEPEPKATIQRFDADGSNQTTFASGTRNPTALAFNPESGDLYALVQERDGLGDHLPSDYLIRVQEGGFLRLALRLHWQTPATWLRQPRPGQGTGNNYSRLAI